MLKLRPLLRTCLILSKQHSNAQNAGHCALRRQMITLLQCQRHLLLRSCSSSSNTADKDINDVVEKHQFQAETRMLLDIVAKSLYSEKEVFLRELVSNSNDALEKRRFLQVQEGICDDMLSISISTDKANFSITIMDNGIGMTKNDLIYNLGTIARSGSKAFMEELKNKGTASQPNTIIGQFGVGFYSVFMVANKVELTTKSIEPNSKVYKWTSDGLGTYTISTVDKFDAKCGTKIVIHLKPEFREYASSDTVHNVIQKYSSFVANSISIDGSESTSLKPLWLMNPKDVSLEQHQHFYKYLTNTTGNFRFVLHFRTDVPVAINAVLYFPLFNTAPLDIEKFSGVALYSKRVLIKSEALEIIPRWLRFIKGVVDTEDIPLNLSREILQNTPLLRKIESVITNKILKYLLDRSDKEKENFLLFYNEFSFYLKEGIAISNDQVEKEEIAKLLFFETSKTELGESISLPTYVKRKAALQTKMFYLTAPSRALAETSPYLDTLKEKDYEVLYCFEPYDELVLMRLHKFRDLALTSIESFARSSDSFAQNNPIEPPDENVADLCHWLKRVLRERIEKACTNKSLQSHPCIVTIDDIEQTRQYLKMRPAKNLSEDLKFSLFKPRLEINPRHTLIKQLNNLFKSNEQLATLVAEQLFINALVYAGLLDDPHKVVNNINKIMELSLAEKSITEVKG